MQVEYEATFVNIKKDEIREVLKKIGADLIHAEKHMKRTNLFFPSGHEIPDAWLRVRDEDGDITMSLKMVTDENKIESQKETILRVDDYEEAIIFLEGIGCKRKSFQETKREMWRIDNVVISLDEWPFLEPFMEVEGENEADVKKVVSWLGFDYADAKFCTVADLYSKKYGISKEKINNEITKITFEGDNPFEE